MKMLINNNKQREFINNSEKVHMALEDISIYYKVHKQPIPLQLINLATKLKEQNLTSLTNVLIVENKGTVTHPRYVLAFGFKGYYLATELNIPTVQVIVLNSTRGRHIQNVVPYQPDMIDINLIQISKRFENCPPRAEKIFLALNEVWHDRITPITLSKKSYKLTDGYSRYVVATMLGIDKVSVIYK